MQESIIQAYQKQFGNIPLYVVRSPGRVNLIGEHTDYNDGFVLPMAIDRAIWIALSPRQDERVLLHSLDFPKPADFSIEQILHGEGWTDYVRGMTWALEESGYPVAGWQGVLNSDIPLASGLSSSAALELALARAYWALNRWEWDGIQMARVSKKMENDWLHLKSGIMDQMIVALGQENQALLIDCRDLTTQLVPLPEGVSIVVMDTSVRRGLVDSAYNERVEQCRLAADYFGVDSLREVSAEMFAKRSEGMDDLIRRRARHVISENERTLQAAAAMQAGDAVLLGKLMDASHVSMRDDYQISCPELDAMVEISQRQTGCLGARMTGGGFGGCAIALVTDPKVKPFIEKVAGEYMKATYRTPSIFTVRPTQGAGLVAEY